MNMELLRRLVADGTESYEFGLADGRKLIRIEERI